MCNKIQTTLNELQWMQYFRIEEKGQLLQKTAVIKGDKIGALNPFGQFTWLEKSLIIIKLPENV